jgi:hypothetical protein
VRTLKRSTNAVLPMPPIVSHGNHTYEHSTFIALDRPKANLSDGRSGFVPFTILKRLLRYYSFALGSGMHVLSQVRLETRAFGGSFPSRSV